MMRKKLIFWENAVETLGYFSNEMAEYFMEKGYECFFVNHKQAERSMEKLATWVEPGNTVLVTFNFIGLSGEDFCQRQGESIWEQWKVECYCILVDHPFYYYKQLHGVKEKLTVFCVDRQHVSYVHRFYPKRPCYLLPLAGNRQKPSAEGITEWIPYEKRSYDISLIANFVPLEDLEIHLLGQSEEYVEFYREIISDLKENPSQAVDEVLERYIRREIPDAKETDICSAEAGMIAVDLYIRSLYRTAVIRALTDAGLRVHVFGRGWSKCRVPRKENLISNGKMLTSAQCVGVIRDSRIALNVMPWFKDGAHDRIFTAMLNGAVSLTDDSRYLREILTDGRDVCFYELPECREPVFSRQEAREPENTESAGVCDVAEKAKCLLENPGKAKEIIQYAYETADSLHTWKMRAKQLERFLEDSAN